MVDQRPNPDELLRRVIAEQPQRTRGRLKIFLGMCAGVGKTYAMLEAGRVRGIEGVDIMVGFVETHGRIETEELLLGLDLLPNRRVEYRGVMLREFDLDACLTRKPELVLVDELAHTNAPGSRHEKRYQDVQELLAAGISVYTTLNTQHIESLNDLVSRITGVIVRETVPDSLVDGAEEIELVDLPPEELLTRLKDGKVYVPAQASRAADNFFRHGNLIALREMALRYVAERVDLQVQEYRRGQAGARTWPVRERLLVCVSPSPQSARLVRATRRLATRLRAEWFAVHVETPQHASMAAEDRGRLYRILRLAEQLGAQTATVSGTDVAAELAAYARTHNVTKIVVGKSAQSRWKRWLRGSAIDELARKTGDIDLYVISGEGEHAATAPSAAPPRSPRWTGLLAAALTVAACTAVGEVLQRYLDTTNLAMLYLVGLMLVALRGSRGAAIAVSILSVAAFDFFFVPPYLTFRITDVQYLVTFVVMLGLGLLVSGLTMQVRQRAEAARRRAATTSALYDLTRQLADVLDLPTLLRVAVAQCGQTFESAVTIYLPTEGGKLAVAAGAAPRGSEERGISVADWVFRNGQPAGHGTNTLPAAPALYLPLEASRRTEGVLAVEPGVGAHLEEPDEMHLLETFARQIALAVERVRLTDEAGRAQLQIESEHLRNALLSSVSHDFRTPLASILGASSSLLADGPPPDEATRRELTRAIYTEAERLDRLVRNLLDMTRLESGAVQLKKDWHPLEELVGAALHRLRHQLGDRPVVTHLPDDLPLVLLDGALIEQVLVNLVENALKYTPPDSPIEISASPAAGEIILEVADRGPGLPPEQIQRVFEKFYRAAATDGGVGLGLAICEAIVTAHGGRIWAENRPGGGTFFRCALPLGGEPPKMEVLPERGAVA